MIIEMRERRGVLILLGFFLFSVLFLVYERNPYEMIGKISASVFTVEIIVKGYKKILSEIDVRK